MLRSPEDFLSSKIIGYYSSRIESSVLCSPGWPWDPASHNDLRCSPAWEEDLDLDLAWTSSLLYAVTIFTVVWIVSGKSVCAGGCAESQIPSSGEQSLYSMGQYSLHTSVNLMLAFHKEIFQAVLYSVAKIIHANWSYLMDMSCRFCLIDTVDFFCSFK